MYGTDFGGLDFKFLSFFLTSMCWVNIISPLNYLDAPVLFSEKENWSQMPNLKMENLKNKIELLKNWNSHPLGKPSILKRYIHWRIRLKHLYSSESSREQ